MVKETTIAEEVFSAILGEHYLKNILIINILLPSIFFQPFLFWFWKRIGSLCFAELVTLFNPCLLTI